MCGGGGLCGGVAAGGGDGVSGLAEVCAGGARGEWGWRGGIYTYGDHAADEEGTPATSAHSILDDETMMEINKIYPLDAVFDTPEDVPEEIQNNKRYSGVGPFTIAEVAKAVEADYGKIDILVHSLANGPEVTKPLLETSRKGYLAASSASAYSAVAPGNQNDLMALLHHR